MKFETFVMMVESIVDHPNADRLSVVKLKGYSYNIVTAKLEDGSPRYKPGDLVVYVQEGSIVPEYLLRKGFWDDAKNKGILAGANGDRVKPITLRGVLSEGIMFPVEGSNQGRVVPCIRNETQAMVVSEGDDVSEFLGVKKWIPEIPASMAGDVFFPGPEYRFGYDIEDIKKHPALFTSDGELGGPAEVVITEKCHGTFCIVGVLPKHIEEALHGRFLVSSKGMAAQGLYFKANETNLSKNLYVRTILNYLDKLTDLADQEFPNLPVFVLGEIFGRGVQDLAYGFDKPTFRAFDLYVGLPGRGTYVNVHKYFLFDKWEIPHVPVLAHEMFSPELVERHTNGKSTFDANQIREGIVITHAYEATAPTLGRVILKSVSADYKNRKNGTELQ